MYKTPLITLLFLVSLTLGCNILSNPSSSETPRRVNPLEATAQPAEAETPTALTIPASLPTTLSDRLDTLTAYQVAMTLRNSSGSFTMTASHTNAAQYLNVTTTGINFDKLGSTGSVAMYELNGNYYLEYSQNNSWIAFPTQQPPTIFVPSFALAIGLVGNLPTTAQRADPAETVNGVPTYRYDFTQQPIQGVMMSGQMWLGGSGYVVKLVAKSDDGAVNINYDLTNINGNVAINLPAAAQNATFMTPSTPTPIPTATLPITEANQSPLPVMPDAEELTSTATSLQYFSPSSLTAISDFYTTELEKQGWRADQDHIIFETNRFEVGYKKPQQYIMVKATQQVNRFLVEVTLQNN